MPDTGQMGELDYTVVDDVREWIVTDEDYSSGQ